MFRKIKKKQKEADLHQLESAIIDHAQQLNVPKAVDEDGSGILQKRMNIQRHDQLQQDVEFSTEADLNNQQEYEFGHRLINSNIKRKKFKGLAADIDGSNAVQIDPRSLIQLKNQSNSDYGRFQVRNQVGLIQNQNEQARSQNPHYSAYRGDKQMEEYVEQRMREERQKIEGQDAGQDGINLSNQPVQDNLSNPIDQLNDDKVLYEMPKHIDVDTLKSTNRAIVDKPIQWTAGMMEVPSDPMNRVKQVDNMIEQHMRQLQKQQDQVQETSEQGMFQNQVTSFLKGNQQSLQRPIPDENKDRKIIQRGSRGGFQGQMGTHSETNLTRVGRGEYSQMMRTMNFDHHQALNNFEKGQGMTAVSQKAKKEKEKQQQFQQNQQFLQNQRNFWQ